MYRPWFLAVVLLASCLADPTRHPAPGGELPGLQDDTGISLDADAVASVDVPADAAGPGLDVSPDPDASAPPPLPPASNQVRLNGDPVGQNDASDPPEHKAIALSVDEGSRPDLSVSGAWLVTRSTSVVNTPRLIARVANHGSHVLCFVKASPLRFLGTDGAPLVDASAYVGARVLAISATITTGTCLGPGESGWMTHLIGSAAGITFDAIDSASALLSARESDDATAPAAEIVPTGYGYVDNALSAQLINSGTTAGLLGPRRAIFLDGDGVPRWVVIGSGNGSVIIAPGASYTTAPDSVLWQGLASTVELIVDYEDAVAP
jgi:hypothetical protein